MMAMLKELSEDPDSGLLGYEMSTFGGLIVQYWRSFEHLERFANDPDDLARARLAELLEAGRQGHPLRHLARELPGARGGVRSGLRQHAAVRPGEGLDAGDPGGGQQRPRPAQATGDVPEARLDRGEGTAQPY